MRWCSIDLWKADISIASSLLVLMIEAPVPTQGPQTAPSTSRLATPLTATMQAAPTVDATATALAKEKLIQEIAQHQHTLEYWSWSNAESISSTIVIVLGALFGLWRWLLKPRGEREKRAQERFQKVVEGLGSERKEARVGAAITPRLVSTPKKEVRDGKHF